MKSIPSQDNVHRLWHQIYNPCYFVYEVSWWFITYFNHISNHISFYCCYCNLILWLFVSRVMIKLLQPDNKTKKIQIFINTMFGFLLSGFRFVMISMLVFIFCTTLHSTRGMNSLLQVLYHIQNTIIFIAHSLSIKVIVLPILGMLKAILKC